MRTTRIGVGGVLVMAAALASAPAWGQVQQVVGGNAMDANPQVGSGGSNRPVQGYVPINGNDIINGNVGGLKYFHGRLPYRSENSFGGNLPSSAIGNFARVSSTGLPLGATYQGVTQPYYLPSATVSTAQGRVGASPYGSGMDNRYGLGSAAYLNGARTAPVRSNDSGMIPGVTTPFSPFARQSADPYGTRPEDITALQPTGLYGFKVNALVSGSARDPRAEAGIKARKSGKAGEDEDVPVRTDIGVTAEQSTDARVGQPIKGAVRAGVQATPADAMVGRTNAPKEEEPVGNEVYSELMGQIRTRRGATTQPGGVAAPALGVATTMGSPTGTKIEVDPVTGQPRITKDKGEKGTGDYQSTDPTKPFYRPEPAEKKKPLEDLSTETLQSGKSVDPMQTFVGKKDSPFNEYMRVAERQLKAGRYIDAVETYQEARIFSRDNPLTKIGEAHAKLAAGMYVDTAILLRDHIEQQPELAAVRYDLLKFLPEQRLAFLKEDLTKLAHGVRANPTASFLLAYMAYQQGDQEGVKRELEYWRKEVKRDPFPNVLLRAWGSEK